MGLAGSPSLLNFLFLPLWLGPELLISSHHEEDAQGAARHTQSEMMDIQGGE